MPLRPALQAHICFQCQLRLLQRPSHSLYFSTATRTSTKRHIPIKPENLQQRNFQIRRQPPGRVYGRPGQEVREEVRSRDSNDPSASPDVIVLRDDIERWKTPPLKIFAPDLKSHDEDIDILAVVESERGIVGKSDVDAHIEELRPTDPDLPLSEEEFGRIWQTLEEGFTNQQLQGYIKAHLPREAGKQWVEKKKVIAKNKALKYKTDWFPEKTKENTPFLENRLRGYSSILHNVKQQTVLQILRNCWNLHVRDVVESNGELEMHIKEDQFRFLINPGISPLETVMARLRHNDGELIEAFISRSVLRITASRRRAKKIAEDIEQNILDRIQKLQVPMSMLKTFRFKALTERTMKGHNLFSQKKDGPSFRIKLLEEIGKMTGTYITISAKMAFIWSINSNPDSKLASPAQVASRLIISYYTDFHKELPLMGLRRTNSSEALIRCDDLDSLSWYDRLRQWVRRTTATAKTRQNEFPSNSHFTSIDGVNKALPTLVASISRTGRMSLENEVLPEKRPAKQGSNKKGPKKNVVEPPSNHIWRAPYTTSHVILGQVLHEKPDAQPIEILPASGDVLISKYQIFSTMVPNLPVLMESMRASNPDIEPTVTESVEMRFEPSPLADEGAKAFQAFPMIQMRFGIEEIDYSTRNLTLKDISALADFSTTDVMLPDRPVDIRFLRRKTYRGRLRRLIGPDAPVSKFLEASKLNLIDGIKTPPSLKIPMDSYMCKDKKAWLPRKSDSNIMDVEYMFSGMDIKKRMRFDFNGWTLIYTDITSGKAGGRQREVRLRPTLTTPSADAIDEEEFVKAAFQLTDIVGQVPIGEDTSNMSNIEWQLQGIRKAIDDSPDYFTRIFRPDSRTRRN